VSQHDSAPRDAHVGSASRKIEQEKTMALGDEIDDVFRREVKSLSAYAKAQAAGGSGVAPPVEEMNQLLMGLIVGVQRSLHLLADRIEDMDDRSP
jgi:hypothetical protein